MRAASELLYESVNQPMISEKSCSHLSFLKAVLFCTRLPEKKNWQCSFSKGYHEFCKNRNDEVDYRPPRLQAETDTLEFLIQFLKNQSTTTPDEKQISSKKFPAP